MEIKGILVSLLAPMENHIANGGEKLLGNASSIKRRPDERVYISGQMQRHAFFSALERLNLEDPYKGNTYVSNGDGISNAIEVDLRADLGGFMHPSAGNYSGRRTSPLSVTPAVALKESSIGRDLLIRLKVNEDDKSNEQALATGMGKTPKTARHNDKSNEQALATREFSQFDMMLMNFHLDITSLSISKKFSYANKFHVKTEFVKHVKEDERKRRVKLFLEATRSLTDYAQQARNATSGEPQKVLIVFDNRLSRKACRYFEAGENERKNILNELNERGAKVIIGDDIEGEKSVSVAYKEALAFLESATLYDPCGGDNNIETFAEAFKL
jgi:CRISPR-associated protein Cst2